MDDSSGTISIAMEFAEGGSLDGVYREVKKLGGRTGEKVLGKVGEGVLNGLTYLHGQKIIHRGISIVVLIIWAAAKVDTRHQTVQHPSLPQRPSQALRFWGQRRIRDQGRCQYLHWYILLHGSGTDNGPILHHHIRCLVVGRHAS